MFLWAHPRHQYWVAISTIKLNQYKGGVSAGSVSINWNRYYQLGAEDVVLQIHRKREAQDLH